VDVPYSDSIISLGLILASLIESTLQTLQGLLHLLHCLLLGMHGLLENLKFGSRMSLPITSCVIKGVINDALIGHDQDFKFTFRIKPEVCDFLKFSLIFRDLGF
jgi:hypothetical protein